MAVPVDLMAALGALPSVSRIEFLSSWTERPDGLFSVEFHAQLSVPATTFMPE